MSLARMEQGRKSPFEVDDYVTAISKTGATTKARGRVTAVHKPLDADLFGEGVEVWEFDVAWEDRTEDVLVCQKCGDTTKSSDQVLQSPNGFLTGGRNRQRCCDQPMTIRPRRDSRVSEHEIKKLSAIDMIAELNRGESGPLP